MTVGELREILEQGLIGDELVITDYDDRTIKEVVISINKDNECTDVRFLLESA